MEYSPSPYKNTRPAVLPDPEVRNQNLAEQIKEHQELYALEQEFLQDQIGSITLNDFFRGRVYFKTGAHFALFDEESLIEEFNRSSDIPFNVFIETMDSFCIITKEERKMMMSLAAVVSDESLASKLFAGLTNVQITFADFSVLVDNWGRGDEMTEVTKAKPAAHNFKIVLHILHASIPNFSVTELFSTLSILQFMAFDPLCCSVKPEIILLIVAIVDKLGSENVPEEDIFKALNEHPLCKENIIRTMFVLLLGTVNTKHNVKLAMNSLCIILDVPVPETVTIAGVTEALLLRRHDFRKMKSYDVYCVFVLVEMLIVHLPLVKDRFKSLKHLELFLRANTTVEVRPMSHMLKNTALRLAAICEAKRKEMNKRPVE